MSLKITKFTQKIERLAAKSKIVYSIASIYYRDVIKREVALAGITGDDKILCIGGGVCPFSAILFHQTTGAKVTVIDNDFACVEKARDVIDRLRLSGHIDVQYKDGCCDELPLAGYSVVHFALQVDPIERAFTNVKNRVGKGAKLCVRRPKKNLYSLYRPFSDYLLKNCRHTAHGGRCNIGSTFLYVIV